MPQMFNDIPNIISKLSDMRNKVGWNTIIGGYKWTKTNAQEQHPTKKWKKHKNRFKNYVVSVY